MAVRILIGDVRAKLAELPDESVHCVVTSPPYFGLRDYGVEGQIGLEPTPAEFVAVMVEVFREVRRVLRKDGTLWLNLGDSYSSGGRTAQVAPTLRGNGKDEASGKQAYLNNFAVRPGNHAGFKPKDLLGIPWRVAFALQQPYYTGKIKSEADRIWLAAMIDGEGCMFLHKRKVGQNNGQGYERKNDSYGAGLEVANTHKSIVDRCLSIAGQGSICRQDKDRKQPLYRWNLRSNECRELIRELYPHLVAKRHQARLLLGCPSSGTLAEKAHVGLMALHNGLPCNVDFPVPESMFEPGWYLRQDLIWSKSNPMPESVTDRCTKAHEYLFLLSKSARYHYDAEAIAEEGSGRTPGNRNYKYDGIAGHETKQGILAQADVPQLTRNKRSVWEVATQPFKEAHFATFPPDLIEPCIKAGCPKDGTVLDPFGGAGTTGLVADRLQRDAILIELNPAYAEIARARLTGDAPLFAEVA